MDAMIRWIGGASAAVLLGLTGAALASGALTPAPQPVPSLEQAIPIEPPALAQPRPAPSARPEAAPSSAAFTVKRVLPIGGPIKYGEWHWDDAGVPEGPLVITIDLEARVLSVFRNGYEIGAAAVLVGTDEHPTPLGTFPILRKQRHNVSEKYDNAPMPWSMFLTRDGIAIHGGSQVENGYASHGCIAGPDEFVAKIFAVTKPGDKVIITRGAKLALGQPIV
ncbi:MAG: L,D-transpeptidase family protein [Cypionkella sp.]